MTFAVAAMTAWQGQNRCGAHQKPFAGDFKRQLARLVARPEFNGAMNRSRCLATCALRRLAGATITCLTLLRVAIPKKTRSPNNH
jgi:hypothetical protein